LADLVTIEKPKPIGFDYQVLNVQYATRHGHDSRALCTVLKLVLSTRCALAGVG
jgi:hypothetical protein